MSTILKKIGMVFVLWGSLGGNKAAAVQVAAEHFKTLRHELKLRQELPIYKDPSLFLGTLGELYSDPAFGWESLMRENPLLTSVKGDVCLLQLGAPTPFKNFGRVSVLYEMAEPKLRLGKERKGAKRQTTPLIIPVKLCGHTAYNDTLGFVLESDLIAAQKAKYAAGSMPPSTRANEIPTWESQP